MALRAKAQPKLLNVNRIPGQPKKRKKVTLVFDEDKRRDFLKGFHKRKLQRQKKAQEELQMQLKEERKKIKQNAREHYKKLVSNRDIPELEQLLSQKEYETEGHTVSILEVSVADLTEGNTWIGENKGVIEKESEEEDENDQNGGGTEEEEIVGMSLNEKKKITKSKKFAETKEINNKKDLRKEIKKAALKQVQKSKAFQQKQKLERQKNKKESLRKLKKIQKAQKRKGKLKKRSTR